MNEKLLDRYLARQENLDAGDAQAKQHQRALFEQYAQRDGRHTAARARLWERYTQGAPLTGAHGLRRELGAIDLQYFGMAYLPHYYMTPPPLFHEELDHLWLDLILKGRNVADDPKSIDREQGSREAIAAPRGHAKSTTVTFKDNLHAVLYQYKHYLLILSDSSEQAEVFLGDLKSELEDNPQLREDFGELTGKRYWTNAGFLTSTNIKVEGIGSGKKIRGRRHQQWRPDLIVLDDIENDTNINTPDQRDKLKNWFFKAVSSAGDWYTDIVYVGTVLHYDSLLCKVMQTPSFHSVKYQAVIRWAENTELWDEWRGIYTDLSNPSHQEDADAFYEANRAELLRGTAVLWEAKNDYRQLMQQKVNLGDAAFNSEYQNDPLDPKSCPFSEQTTTFYDESDASPPDFRDPRFVFFGACDPSLGKNKRADTSALLAVALDSTSGLLYVAEADIRQRTPDRIIADAIEMHRRLTQFYGRGFRVFGVESVQFQSFFAEIMAQKSAEAGVYLPIVQIMSLLPKIVRINSLEPYTRNGYLRFSRKHKTLLEQLYHYPAGKNDDGPDGLEMAVKLAIAARGVTSAEYTSIRQRALRFEEGCF